MGKCVKAGLCVIIEIKEGLSGLFMVQVFNKNDICIGQYDLSCWAKERVYFDIQKCGEYKIKVTLKESMGILSPISASRSAWLDPACSKVQYFIFSKTKPLNIPGCVNVDFSLHDKYYPNLPIEEGVLILWRNM